MAFTLWILTVVATFAGDRHVARTPKWTGMEWPGGDTWPSAWGSWTTSPGPDGGLTLVKHRIVGWGGCICLYYATHIQHFSPQERQLTWLLNFDAL